jgi:CelD/BcsL family acetyltransferase involved in cellulose biosynthesis
MGSLTDGVLFPMANREPRQGMRSASPGCGGASAGDRQAAARGDAVYDFLAGEARYKSSLATGTRELVWTELVPAWSWRGLVARLACVLRRG